MLVLYDSEIQLSFSGKGGIIIELHLKPFRTINLNISTFGSHTNITERYPVHTDKKIYSM